MYTDQQRRSLGAQAFGLFLLAGAVFFAAYEIFGCMGG